MRQLIIDTATEALSVALFDDGTLIAHHHEIAGRGHAEKLIPIISALPDGGKANEIIVDNGPGSFTGVRIGLAAARALGYAWGVDVRGYTSLSILAAIAREEASDNEASNNEETLFIAITGGHGELFWQKFVQKTLAPLGGISSTPIAELAGTVTAPTVYGSGAKALVEARGNGEAIILRPDARHFPLLPPAHLHYDVLPYYGRGADAIPLARRKPQQKLSPSP